MFEDRLEEVFQDLVELSVDDRRARLDAIHRSDPAFHAELSALLSGYEAAPRFLAPADGPPVRLGKYPVEREVGRGGMGIVYLARDPDLERELAIKLLPRAAFGGDRLGSLREEARVLASVNHPNVAQVHSIEEISSPETGHCSILTMEYVPGTTLTEQLRAGPLPLEKALDYGRQIAAALEAAHARSVVHRDLKPQNVRVTPAGWVKVLDFGLARVIPPTDETSPAAVAGDDPSSSPAGTPGYMSPEQCRGDLLDARSDLWSFGAVLFECLSGEPVVRAANPAELLEANRRGTSSLESLPLSVPPRVADLLRSCLEADPRDRAASATAVRQILDEELLRSRAAVLFGPTSDVADRAAERGSKKGNLPRPWSSFVGRTVYLAQLEAAISQAPLVTLSGPGGVGKTRTALEYAAQAESNYPGGVWFIDLAAITSGSELPAAIVHTLRAGGARTASHPGEPHRTVAESFGGERALLILDNCEHVVDDAARFVQALLTLPSGLRVLATSRQPLGLRGEQVVPLPPFDHAPESPGTASPSHDAVQLFLERARGRWPGFAPGRRGLEIVRRICHRLDGLPLAIELAATQVRHLSLEELLAHVESGRPMPAGGLALPERHRSMRNVVEWSFELLSPRERALLRRLSIFRGGCTLPAAEAVCAGWGGIEEWEVCDLLSRLVERSLVEPEMPRSASGADSGPVRYRMLETIRSYGADRRSEDATEEENLTARYLLHFCAVSRIRDEERTPLRSAWMRRLAPEQANLLYGLEVALTQGKLRDAFELAEPLEYGWIQTGEWIDATRWMDRLLAARVAAGLMAGVVRAVEVRLLSQAGLLAAIRGLAEKAQPIIDEALILGTKLGEPEPLAQAHEAMGVARWRQGRLDEADSHLNAARRCFEAAGDWGGVAVSTGNLGILECSRGNLEPARRLFEEYLRLSREMRDRSAAAAALVNLGWIAGRQGRVDEARKVSAEAISIYRATGDMPAAAMALQNLGETLTKAGDLANARVHLRESSRIRLRQGDQVGLVSSIVLLGRLADREGRLSTAAEILAGVLHQTEIGGYQCRPDTLDALKQWQVDLARILGEEEMAAAAARGVACDPRGLLELADPGEFEPGPPGEDCAEWT